MTFARSPFFVDVDGASLWTMAFGPVGASAIVLVGGWTGSSELWLGPIGHLGATFRCLTFDHRGTGATISDPASITHTRLVDDVVAIMDAQGIKRAVLAAESAGAAVAPSAASRHPDRVARVVLVDAFIPPDAPGDDDPFVQALRTDYAATAGAFVDACAPPPIPDAIRSWGRAILARSTAEHAVALLRADVPDPPLDFAAIRAPVLLIHCVGDAIAPLAGAAALAAALPSARLHVINGDEHVPTITRPAEIATLMQDWLATLA